jgi:hypothetical protein
MIWIEKPDFSGGEIQLNAVMPQTIHAQDAINGRWFLDVCSG